MRGRGIFTLIVWQIQILSAFEQKPTLHRYWKTMASHTKRVAELLVEKYEGNANDIWNDNPTVETLYERLTEFKGIGSKKVNTKPRPFGSRSYFPNLFSNYCLS